MTDSLEAQLQTELREAADAASVPPLDIDGLIDRGTADLRRRRRRTGSIVVAAAAAVAVVVGGVAAVRSYVDNSPQTGHGNHVATHPLSGGPPEPHGVTVASLPKGAPPKLAYWVGGVLHWPGGEARIHYPRLNVGGDRVLVQSQTAPGSNFKEQLLEDGKLVALPVKSAAAAVISPNGQFVAWQVLDGKQTRIVVWRDGVEATLELPVESACCTGLYPALSGIDDAGRVYLAPFHGWIMWDVMGGKPLHVNPMDGGRVLHLASPTRSAAVYGATAFGPVFFDNNGTVYGRISDNKFVEMGRLSGQDATWSSDGQLVAWAAFSKSGADELAVRDLATGKTTKVPLPTDVRVIGHGWESDEALLVSVASKGPQPRWYLLRCAPSADRCQVAADLGAADKHSLGPALAR